jgi:hypothetical protein
MFWYATFSTVLLSLIGSRFVVGPVVDLPGAVILRSALKSWHVPVGTWFCSGFVGHGRVLHEVKLGLLGSVGSQTCFIRV